MEKLNKILIIMLVCVFVVFGTILGYLYFGTDTFKRNDEMFFKLLKSEEKYISEFVDSDLIKYFSKLEDESYTNNSELTFNVEVNEDEYKRVIDNVNNLKIQSESIVDSKNNSIKNDIVIDYGKKVKMPFELVKQDEIYGLKNKYLNEDMYFAIENKNLKSFFDKLGLDSKNIPDKIDILDNEKLFTKEEIERIKMDLTKIIKNKLEKENFIKEKIDDKVKYSLNIDKNKYVDINIALINYLKDNEEIKNKIFRQQINEEKPILDFDKIIESLEASKEENSKLNYFNINLISKNKKLINIYLKIEDEEIFNINVIDEQNFKGYEINSNQNKIIVKKSKLKDSLKYNFEIKSKLLFIDSKINLKLALDYKGLEDMKEVLKNIKITLSTGNSEENFYEYTYNIDSNIQFNNKVQLEQISKDNVYILNDYNKDDIQTVIQQILEVLRNKNIEQMSALGLKEEENPILYSNPISLSYIMANNGLIEKAEEIKKIEAYNSEFYDYEGIRSGTDARALYDLIENHNNMNIDNPRKQINLSIEEENISNVLNDLKQGNIDSDLMELPSKDKINPRKTYDITFTTDKKTGYITACNIREK